MTDEHRDGLYLLILGSFVLLILGSVLSTTSRVDMIDYRAMYYPARCIMHHCDPYSEIDVLNLARSEGGVRPSDTDRSNSHFARYLYLPTTFTITVPFALLPWEVSRTLWMAFIGMGFIAAAFLMRDVGSIHAPFLAGTLAGFFLANNELLMVVGNVAGIAIVLCIIAAWCFVCNRFVGCGIFFFAMSLLLKPHDSGLVWLYFLLAGGIYRRRALQTFTATVALGLPGVVWTYIVAPNWIHEFLENLAVDAMPGQRADPAIASLGSHGLSMMVNLQTIFSSFWHDPRIYNNASFLVCGPILLVWIMAVLRSRHTPSTAWIALASAAALTMLPFYHRQYDTKLLLLTIPGCALLWSEGGAVGWIALILECAAFMLTGDLSWIALLALLEHGLPTKMALTESILKYVQIFSSPLTLLLIGSFYLWVYVRWDNSAQRERTALPREVAKYT